MSEEKLGLFQAIWRFISFYKLRKALGIARAADRQFTGSVGGIRDAYELHQDKLVRQYQELRDAVAEVETVIETDRLRLEELNTQEDDLLTKREGALTKFEEAQESNAQAEMQKHQAAFERFDAQIQKIEEQQTDLEGRIKESEQTMQGYLTQLTEMQSEIQHLPQEKARAIADYVSANKIIELNDRLQRLQSSIERGPIDAVLEQNKKLTAKARVSARLRGTDVKQQDDEYAAAGRRTTSNDRMEQMLAARKKEQVAKTGEKPSEAEARPEI